MPVDFSGTWNLHSSDNFEGYMLALGRQRGPRRGGAVGGGRARLGVGARATRPVRRFSVADCPICASGVLRPPAHVLVHPPSPRPSVSRQSVRPAVRAPCLRSFCLPRLPFVLPPCPLSLGPPAPVPVRLHPPVGQGSHCGLPRRLQPPRRGARGPQPGGATLVRQPAPRFPEPGGAPRAPDPQHQRLRGLVLEAARYTSPHPSMFLVPARFGNHI